MGSKKVFGRGASLNRSPEGTERMGVPEVPESIRTIQTHELEIWNNDVGDTEISAGSRRRRGRLFGHIAGYLGLEGRTRISYWACIIS